MAITKYLRYIISLITKGSPYYLSREIIKDSLNIKNSVSDNEKHISAAINWLLNAQKATKDGGVSAMYSLYQGWHASYSETTGYIISTMFNYYNKTKDGRIKDSAIKMVDWEMSKQMKNGAFPGGATGNKEFPIVFNTGQVTFGMVRAYQETKKNKIQKSCN